MNALEVERIAKLSNATPAQLAALDRILDGQLDGAPELAPSLRLLKMGTACHETGLSRSTLWRAIQAGTLKTIALRPGANRIAEAELRRFIAGK